MTPMLADLQLHQREISEICRLHHVRRLEVFGSSVSGGFHPESSDLDFLVEFQPSPPGGYADAFFGLQEALEALFKRHVDLVVPSAIRNPYFKEAVDETRTLLYAA
jgi:hypothetical protein